LGRAPAPRRPATGLRAAPQRVPLSVIHAEALYQPVPPVGYDDDGYPYEDSSVSEGWNHDDARRYLQNALRARYDGREDALAIADMSLFFEQGTRHALVVPDVALAFNVRGLRDGKPLSYKVWEQGETPDFVMEVLSKKTWRKDVRRKPGLYADLGVEEYWVFDPDRVSDGPPLWGGLLSAGAYATLPELPHGGFHSPLLDLELFHEGDQLRCRIPETGEVIPRYEDYARMHQAAKSQAEAERQRAETERQRAETERARAEAAEARVAELEALLRQPSGH
jgi:Uma2 family endonuclease